jgi:hypothetical protein
MRAEVGTRSAANSGRKWLSLADTMQYHHGEIDPTNKPVSARNAWSCRSGRDRAVRPPNSANPRVGGKTVMLVA